MNGAGRGGARLGDERGGRGARGCELPRTCRGGTRRGARRRRARARRAAGGGAAGSASPATGSVVRRASASVAASLPTNGRERGR